MEFFKKITIYAILLVIFLLIQKPVMAMETELNLSNSMQLEGLNFWHPLPEDLGIQSSTLDFQTYKKIVFQTDDMIFPPSEPTAVPSIKSDPTSIPTPSEPLLTIKPTQIPPPSPIPTSTPAPTVAMKLSTGGLNADTLFSMSNNYRVSKGLAPFQKDDRVCQLAVARAPEINAEIAEGHMHSGKDSHNFPYWFTENIISLGSETAAFNWWINDEIHRVQIEADNKYSCVACSGYACAQEFTNFQPK